MFDIYVPTATEPTPLCELMDRHGSDKGSVGRARHTYTRYYAPLLSSRREEPLRVLELGIYKGGSLRAWRDFLPNAKVYGIDFEPDCMFSEPRIETMICDSTDVSQIARLLATYKFDVVIDDGPHEMVNQLAFLSVAWSCLMSGGVYIIEDVQPHAGPFLQQAASVLYGLAGPPRLVEMRCEENSFDNRLLVMARR